MNNFVQTTLNNIFTTIYLALCVWPASQWTPSTITCTASSSRENNAAMFRKRTPCEPLISVPLSSFLRALPFLGVVWLIESVACRTSYRCQAMQYKYCTDKYGRKQGRCNLWNWSWVWRQRVSKDIMVLKRSLMYRNVETTGCQLLVRRNVFPCVSFFRIEILIRWFHSIVLLTRIRLLEYILLMDLNELSSCFVRRSPDLWWCDTRTSIILKIQK